MFHILERNLCPLIVWHNILYMAIRTLLLVLFISFISILIFCLLDLSKTKKCVEISQSYCEFINFFLQLIFFHLLFIYLLFLAALGHRHCMRAFSSCGEQGLPLIVVHRLLTVVASLVAEHGLQECRLPWLWHTCSVVVARGLQERGLQQLGHSGSVVVARGLQSAGSVVVAHGLSCSAACGIFLDQGSNPHPLHWQADS